MFYTRFQHYKLWISIKFCGTEYKVCFSNVTSHPVHFRSTLFSDQHLLLTNPLTQSILQIWNFLYLTISKGWAPHSAIIILLTWQYVTMTSHEWDDICLKPHSDSTMIKTLSNTQIKRLEHFFLSTIHCIMGSLLRDATGWWAERGLWSN